MPSIASKNPVKAAFKLVQQVWGKSIQVQCCDVKDQPHVFRFRYLEIVGNGTFGIVCRAKDLDTNEIVAIKTVYQDEGHQNRELSIIKGLKHPNIVGLRRYFYTRNETGEEFLSLVLDYMPMSLDRVIKEARKKMQPLPESFIRLAMYQFMRALEYLHGMGICHRDIKPHNLLVDVDAGIVKLCDFGCSKRLIEGEPNIQYICARYYRAPEIVFGWSHYSCAIDIWSAGCVMAEMVHLKPIFAGQNSVDQLAEIVKVLGAPTGAELQAMGQDPQRFKPAENRCLEDARAAVLNAVRAPGTLDEPAIYTDLSNDAIGFLMATLGYAPQSRLTALQALSHAFFASITGQQQASSTGSQPSCSCAKHTASRTPNHTASSVAATTTNLPPAPPTKPDLLSLSQPKTEPCRTSNSAHDADAVHNHAQPS